MSDEKTNILGQSDRSRLFGDVTLLMLKGAGYACAVVVATWLVVAVIAAVGKALPPESRDAADPTPLSAVTVAPGPVVSV